jgi:hypothetical protein
MLFLQLACCCLASIAVVHAQFVSYTLAYNSADCSGTAVAFSARNLTTCVTFPCSAFGGGSIQGHCFQGTLQALVNPVQCPGCAYCAAVNYAEPGCSDPNQWVSSSAERMGICVNGGSGWIVSYGCTPFGLASNYTSYSDAACTQTLTHHPLVTPGCVPGQFECNTVGTSIAEPLCSYTNLFTGGGGGQNGTTGAASLLSASIFLLGFLLWIAG